MPIHEEYHKASFPFFKIFGAAVWSDPFDIQLMKTESNKNNTFGVIDPFEYLLTNGLALVHHANTV